MLPQALAVVAGRDQQQPLVSKAGADASQQPTQLGIDEGDFSQVGTARKCRREPRRRLVACMGVIEVDPQKEAIGRPLEPGEGGVDHLVRGPFGVAGSPRDPSRGAIVVVVEAPIEPEAALQHQSADHGRRGVAGLLHALCQGRRLPAEPLDGIVPHPVSGWIEPRHQGGVGRKRQRGGRNRHLETNSPSGDAVEMRSMGVGRPIAADAVRPQRVDADQQHAIRPLR